MKDIQLSIIKEIQSNLNQKSLELIYITPITNFTDQFLRLKTIQEISEKFKNDSNDEKFEYIIQVKPKIFNFNQNKKNPIHKSVDKIHFKDGTLNFQYLFKSAKILLQSKEYELARRIYKIIFHSGEYTSLSLLKLGKCFELEGNHQEAILHYEKSITYQASLEAYQALSALFIKQKNYQKAVEIFKRTLYLEKLNSIHYFNIHKSYGNCLIKLKKFQESKDHYKKALSIFPKSDQTYSNLGVLFLNLEEIDKAKLHFKKALELNKKNHYALTGLGICYLLKENLKKAHHFFIQSLNIFLNQPLSLFLLIQISYTVQEYQESEKILSQYIFKFSNKNIYLLYGLSGMQFHLNQFNKSESTLKKILKIQPNYFLARGLTEKIKYKKMMNTNI